MDKDTQTKKRSSMPNLDAMIKELEEKHGVKFKEAKLIPDGGALVWFPGLSVRDESEGTKGGDGE